MENYCSIHNRKMLPSKFGENQYWCPDCFKAKKEATPNPQKAINPAIIDRKEVLLQEIDKKLGIIINHIVGAIDVFGPKL